MIVLMQEVTLRPASKPTWLKPVIVLGDLMFLSVPWITRSFSFGAVFGVSMVVVSLAIVAGWTFLGWLGLDMRVEVGADAVRSYYFWPKPFIFPRERITGVQVVMMPRNGSYVPCLVLVSGAAKYVPQLTRRTQEQAETEAERLRAALKEVEPAVY